jgi:hypothetical protein
VPKLCKDWIETTLMLHQHGGTDARWGTFEHDPLFSPINFRSRLATPRPSFPITLVSRARTLREEQRKEDNLLSTAGHYDEQGDEKNHDPAYRSQPEQPFLDPQSPFYLR